MCCPNYWDSIVETRHSHTSPDTPAEILWGQRWLRKHNLPPDCPRWLERRATGNPPPYIRRQSRRGVRSASTAILRNALAQGADLDDLIIEYRVCRMDKRSYWY